MDFSFFIFKGVTREEVFSLWGILDFGPELFYAHELIREIHVQFRHVKKQISERPNQRSQQDKARQRNMPEKVPVPENPIDQNQYTIGKNTHSLEHEHLNTRLFLKWFSVIFIPLIK